MTEPKSYMYVAFPDRLVMTDNLLLVTEPDSTAVTAFTVQSKNATVAFVSVLGDDEDGTQASRRWVGSYHESGAFMVSAWLAGSTSTPTTRRACARSRRAPGRRCPSGRSRRCGRPTSPRWSRTRPDDGG